MKKLASLVLALMLALFICIPAWASREENSIVYNLGAEPPQMYSIKVTDITGFQLIRHLYTGLLELNQDDMPVPGVAESYTVSEDGLVYTFKLRDDAKWWDGVPVTAHDFCYAWTELLNPQNACSYAQMAYCIKNAEAYFKGQAPKEELGLKVVDELTFEVTLEYPVAYFPYLAAFGVFMPQRQDVVEQYGEAYGTDADKIMGNGAYKLTEWQHEDHITMVKNDQYFDQDNIAIDKLVGRIVKDNNTAYAMFETGELDIVNLTGTTSLLAEQSGYEVLQYSDGSTYYLQMNCEEGPTANPNIRKALGLSINRESFVNNILRDHSRPALTFTNVDIKDNEGKSFSENIAVDYRDADIEKAREYWNKGLEELGMTAEEAAQAITLIADDSDLAKEDAAAFQEYWKAALGVEIPVENMPVKSRVQRMQDREYSVVSTGWGPDYADPATFLEVMLSDSGNNYSGWSNERYDELVNGAKGETDLNKRMDMLIEAENILISEMPIAPLYFRMCDYTVADGLQGVHRSAFQDYCFKWASWAE